MITNDLKQPLSVCEPFPTPVICPYPSIAIYSVQAGHLNGLVLPDCGHIPANFFADFETQIPAPQADYIVIVVQPPQVRCVTLRLGDTKTKYDWSQGRAQPKAGFVFTLLVPQLYLVLRIRV